MELIKFLESNFDIEMCAYAWMPIWTMKGTFYELDIDIYKFADKGIQYSNIMICLFKNYYAN